MILIDDHASRNLDTIAANLFTFLNPKLADGRTYHATSAVYGRISRQRILDNAAGQHVRVQFWDYLLSGSKLNDVIIGRPAILKQIINEVDNVVSNTLFIQPNNQGGIEASPFGAIVQNVFRYDNLYRKKQECSDNCASFELSFCPYCNENTVSVITINHAITGAALNRALGQLDHFYSQLRYPYLALSFFNLIPSCATCNFYKNANMFDIATHFNPFDKRLDDYFAFELDDYLPATKNSVVVKYRNKLAYSSDALDQLLVVNRYNVAAHKQSIYTMVTQLKNYSPKVERSNWEQLKGWALGGLGVKNEYLKANGVPTSRNEINNYALGKLKRDIAQNMGLL